MSGGAARVLAQAKINLFLHVLAREVTGYHQIETLFCRLDLGDDVTVRAAVAGRAVDCRGAAVVPAEQNLAYQAALSYEAACGWPRGFAIEIEKRIPVGGGLGGGSADAAAVLRLLEALNPRPLGEQRVLRLASVLGSDVPYLTTLAPLALAWGRGERLLALPALPPRDVLLLLMPFGISTREAYAWLHESGADPGSSEPAPRAARAPLTPDALSAWADVERLSENDFEPAVIRHHPEIGAALAALRQAGASPARLSGSGSTLFAMIGEERGPPTSAGAEGARLVRTRTAARVVGVERIE